MPERVALRRLGLILAVLALAVGCGDGTGGSSGSATPTSQPTGPVGVAEAAGLAAGSAVQVRGYVLADGPDMVIADLLAESYPPQAGGATLRLAGVDLADLPGVSTSGTVSWTEAPVELTGVVDGGVLTVR